MRIYRNFKCIDCKKVTEEMIDNTIDSIKCECGDVANKMISMPRTQSNTVGKNPSYQ